MTEHATEAAHHAGQAVEHTGQGIKGALSKKLGPMPVGGWLLAVAGGVAVALYFRGRSASSDPAGDTELPTDPPGEFSPNGPTGWDQADPGGFNPGVGGGTDHAGNPTHPGTQAHAHHGEAYKARHATTNAAWREHAVLAMAHMGFGASHVDAALKDYLAGHHLNQGQEVAVAATVARCGPPPHPPKHGPGPGTPPHHHHPGTGTRDNGQTPPTKPVIVK